LTKVLYISYDGMTDQLGQSQVIPYLRELTKHGYSFTILSVEKKRKLERFGAEIGKMLSDLGIEWKKLMFSQGLSILSKLYDQWRVNSKAEQLYKEKKFDMVHCRSYIAAEAALKLKNKFSVPFLFDMRGFWVDERVDSGQWNLKNPLYKFFYKLYKKKEKKYLESSAHIVSLTNKGKEELVNVYHIQENKISVIPCCVDLNHFNYEKISNQQKQRIREQLEIPHNCKVISYLGSLGGWYMTDEMLDFFKVVREGIPNIIFLLITHDEKEKILALAAAREINSSAIRIQPASRNEVPLYLSVSDWSIFFIKDAYSKKASSPTKQGEIMAMGVPIICNDIGDTGKIIRESGAGLIINQFNNDDYNKAISDMNDLLHLKRENLRAAALKYYNLDDGISVYRDVYKEILEN